LIPVVTLTFIIGSGICAKRRSLKVQQLSNVGLTIRHNVGRAMVAASEDRFWNLPLDRPIEIEHDRRLATLGDVGIFILALPES
jgi:hypothetical protein